MTKQRNSEIVEALGVAKAQVTIYSYMNFADGTVLTRFTIIVIWI